jgi:hypothetical protein
MRFKMRKSDHESAHHHCSTKTKDRVQLAHVLLTLGSHIVLELSTMCCG